MMLSAPHFPRVRLLVACMMPVLSIALGLFAAASVQAAMTPSSLATVATTEGDRLALRAGPGGGFAVLATLAEGQGVTVLGEAVAGLRDEFVTAMGDASNFGLAKSLFGAADADGVDLSDPDGLQEWIDRPHSRNHPFQRHRRFNKAGQCSRRLGLA